LDEPETDCGDEGADKGKGEDDGKISEEVLLQGIKTSSVRMEKEGQRERESLD
jgi:hypothetical protein